MTIQLYIINNYTINSLKDKINTSIIPNVGYCGVAYRKQSE